MSEFFRFFLDSDLVIPAIQMFIYMVAINVLMLFGRYRICYLVSLSFAFYWLFWLNKDVFVNEQGQMAGGMYYYLGAVVVFLLAIFFSLSSKDRLK